MTEQKKKRNVKEMLCYATGDMLGGAVGMVISTYYLTFLLYVVGLNPILAALVTGIGKIWDGVTDPVMGVIVDRTVTKWGACRPYFLVSVIPLFFSYFCMWYGWGISGEIAKFLYFTFAYMFFSTALTVGVVPYESLLPRMVDSYDERTNFSSMRMIFSGVACVLSTYVYGLIISPANGNKLSALDAGDFRNLGLILGIFFALPLVVTFFGSKEKYTGVKSGKLTLKAVFRQYKEVLSNKIYRKYFFLNMCGVFISCSVLTPVVLMVMLIYNGDPTITIIIPFALSFWVINIKGAFEIAFFPLNVVMMKKKNKHFPLLIDIPLIMISIIIVAFLKVGSPIWLVLIAMAFLGAGTSCLGFVPMTLLPDLSDVDQLIYGKRREGSNAGLTTMAKKIINGLTITLFGLILGAFGLDTQADNISSAGSGALVAVKIMFCVIPFVMCIIMVILSRTYKLNATTHAKVKELIERKQTEGHIELTEEEKDLCYELTGKREGLWIEE